MCDVTDYASVDPHTEATYPYTREALRFTFHDVDPLEVADMVGGNAAGVYGFDMDKLRRVAVDIQAPTVAEVQVPLDRVPDDAALAGVRAGAQPHLVGSVGEGPLTTEGMPMVADAMALPALHDPMATKSSPTPRSGRARIGRPPRLTQEMIVEAAHEIGLDNMTMKGVADRLGVSVPGLYHHVRGKDDLLRLAAELSAGRIRVPDDHGQHWAEWLFVWALFNRSAFVADPGLIKQFTDGAIGAERTAAEHEHGVGAAGQAGIHDPRRAAWCTGSSAKWRSVRPSSPLKEQQAAATGRPTLAELHRVLALREPHDLPYLRSMLADAMSNATTSLQEFHERLVVVLKGIACHRGEEWSSVEAKIQRFVEGGSAPLRSL